MQTDNDHTFCHSSTAISAPGPACQYLTPGEIGSALARTHAIRFSACAIIWRRVSRITLSPRFAKAVAMFAGIHILGGHWLALQMVAWMGMFAVNSQQDDLAVALEKTFGGKHPCALCCAVESGKQKEKEEQQEQLVDTVNKVTSMPVAAVELPRRAERSIVYFEVVVNSDALTVRPPSPPPWSV
jgi:hypothetical protein